MDALLLFFPHSGQVLLPAVDLHSTLKTGEEVYCIEVIISVDLFFNEASDFNCYIISELGAHQLTKLI